MIGRLLGIGGEQRAISYQTMFASGADFQTSTPSGKVINDTTALKIGAVYAAVRLFTVRSRAATQACPRRWSSSTPRRLR